MKVQADRVQEEKSQSSSDGKFQSQSSGKSTFQFVDSRPEAIAQRKLQDIANNSPHAIQLRAFRDMANNSPQANKIAQFQAMADNHTAAQQHPIQKKENNTGLPDNLKTGVERLSGMSLDDVKVHRNSDKPAQLQAHAYAQGTDIHLGAGQEKHLPHEAWHVVQQKQGRVKPTMQMKGGVSVNDETGLEKEADVLGQKAQSVGTNSETGNDIGASQRMEKVVIQGKFTQGSLPQFSNTQPIQLLEDDIPTDGDLSQDITVTTEEVKTPSKTKSAAVWADLREQVGLMKAGKTTTSKVGATLARRIGSAKSDILWNTIEKLKKLPDAAEPANMRIIAYLEALKKERTEVGKKYDQFIGGPETFMSQEEIDLHLNLFKIGGAHAFITNWHHGNFNGEWNGWGQDRNFVAPLPRANELVADAKNKEGIRTLEEALGIPAWSWVDKCPNGIIWRYIIEPDKIEKAGLSMAGGKESGAYGGQWIAGGETEGGEKEATIAVFKGEEFQKALRDVIKVEALDLSAQTPIKP
jgi:hypothetical protein